MELKDRRVTEKRIFFFAVCPKEAAREGLLEQARIEEMLF
jgi:hypothetical protein